MQMHIPMLIWTQQLCKSFKSLVFVAIPMVRKADSAILASFGINQFPTFPIKQ